MKLTPEQLSQISLLVNEALDLPEAERPAWARSQLPATTEPAVRRALEDMFSGEAGATTFTLALPGVSAISNAQAEKKQQTPRVHVAPGDVVDTYRLLDKIGSGGMGDVWLAERSNCRTRHQWMLT
jgi:hypothetical protein